MTPVKSSNVAAIGYNPERQVMTVKFKNGGQFDYHGVTPDEHQACMAAPSVGKHLHSAIRPSKCCTKCE